ncbi:hypothetical protein HDU77_003555 [Chytriomyces hyalinus]|nr:hypothetical protein HDU77_003555 [Chytriomyces hyalinus]
MDKQTTSLVDKDASSDTHKCVESPQKLEKFVRSSFPVQCPTIKEAQLAIKNGSVFVNAAKVTKPMHKLVKGDLVQFKRDSKAKQASKSARRKLGESLGIRVHFENEHVLVLWKPSGVPVRLDGFDGEQGAGNTAGGKVSLESLASEFSNDFALAGGASRSFKCIPGLKESVSGLSICCKTDDLVDRISSLIRDGLVDETWTVLCQGHAGKLRGLKPGETFTIDDPIDGRPASSMCTFLNASRSRNYTSGFISTILVSAIPSDGPPHPDQIARHFEKSAHPIVSDYIALTGLDFELQDTSSQEVSVSVSLPKTFSNFLQREQSSWDEKRKADLQVLKSHGIQDAEAKLDEGVPVAYISGKKDFYGTSFFVSPAVMIPKIGTEVLVKSVLSAVKARPAKKAMPFHTLDLGTGSGCILLSILKHCPLMHGLGVDISPDAVTIANQNSAAVLSSNQERATFGIASFNNVHSYLNDSYSSAIAAKVGSRSEKFAFDFIVTNPPYLPKKLWDSDRMYAQQKHEPYIAVVSGDDGMEAYRQIKVGMDLAEAWMKKGTLLFVEVNNGELAAAVRGVFETEGSKGWDFLKCEIDGKGLDRCVIFEWSMDPSEQTPLLPNIRARKYHRMWDLLFVTVAFFVIYSARSIVLSLASSVLPHSVAFAALGTLHLSLSFFYLFAASAISDRVGSQCGMFLGSILSVSFNIGIITALTFNGNELLQTMILVPAAFLSGLGVSLMWASHGVYFYRCSPPERLSKNTGVFFALFGSSGIVGPMASSLLIQLGMDIGNVFKAVTAVACTAPVILFYIWKFRPEPSNPYSPVQSEVQSRQQNPLRGIPKVLKTAHLMVSPKMLLLVPMFLVLAANSAFDSGSLPLFLQSEDVSSDLQAKLLLRAIQGAVDMVTSFSAGKLTRMFGTRSMVAAVFGVQLLLQSALFWGHPVNRFAVLAFAAMCIGLCDGILVNQSQILVGTSFPSSCTSQAYAGYKCHLSLGGSIILYSSALMLDNQGFPNMSIWSPLYLAISLAAVFGVYNVPLKSSEPLDTPEERASDA